MIYLILISAFSGALVTLVLQFFFLYRRSPEPIGRTVQYVKAVPDPLLKDYFNNHHVESGQQQQENTTSAASKQAEAASPKPQEASVSSSPKQQPPPPSQSESLNTSKSETCGFLNAIFLFLFRELRDTPVVRHWVTKKIKVEFEELLQTKTAGRLLEGLSLRDVSLGNSLPVFKTAKLMKPVAVNDDGMPEELNFEVDLEYNGGFHLAIDVDLVFGKSAYLFVKMTRVVGRLKLQFTRMPFTHWSFSFLEDPLIDFEVKSQFEGRPLPQLTSIIVNQLKRVIKKKHTLPNYKIRYKPFFPFQVQPPLASTCDQDLALGDKRLVEGRLRVTLVECSRLFILGSYDRETYVHCTFELSEREWREKTRTSIKTTEVVKGPSGSWGMTFRHVAASEGDAVHVGIETVTPNSPAALADLQKGDRLIAIGGVKVTSSVQVPKLLKQAGDRVQVLYERPVRHQTPSAGGATPQDQLVSLDETAPLSQPTGYEEDPATITTMDISESKDNDSEFEELIPESKPPVPPSPAGTAGPPSSVSTEAKEDFLLSINQSPKKTVATLASKPLGTISPILSRKLNLVGLQSPLKPQPKESPKPSPSHKTAPEVPAAGVVSAPAEKGGGGEGPQRPSVPPPPPPARPPVPPRPHIKVTSVPESQCQPDGADGVPAADKSPEKSQTAVGATGGNGDKPTAEKSPVKSPEMRPSTKPAEPAPDTISISSSGSKADLAKDKTSEPTGSSSSNRDSLDEQGLWESSETMYRKREARWPRASVVFEVESHHRFLNVALWCKDPFKLGSLLCLGHATLRLEHVALECLSTSAAEYQSTFRLSTPVPRASVSRTALRSLTTHKGFNEKLCYGDVTLNFTYLKEGEPELPCGTGPTEKEREWKGSSQEEEAQERERERERTEQAHSFMARDELSYASMPMGDMRHNFQDTQFQNPTWCEYCKRKVWTKAASQCMVCAYVCHKKCQEKCLTENPYCIAAGDRRSADPEAKSTINRATTGLTRHIINTSSRLLSLRQVPKARLAEQVAEAAVTAGAGGTSAAEPSPKHTPNTSDNESSDTETYAGASPSKHATGGGGAKLARKEGGLDDSVFIAVKEIGRDLYRGLPTDERSQKLELMLDKLQQEIDQELEHNNALMQEEREATSDARRKGLLTAALAKSGERLQALTLLMIHYRAGIEDLESVESTSPSETHGFPKTKGLEEVLEEDDALMGADVYDSDICSPIDAMDEITDEQICVEALP